MLVAPKAKRLPRTIEAVSWRRVNRARQLGTTFGYDIGYSTGQRAATPAAELTLEELAGMEADYRSRTRGF